MTFYKITSNENKSLTSCVCCTSMNVFLLPWSFSFLSSLNGWYLHSMQKGKRQWNISYCIPQHQFISESQLYDRQFQNYIPLYCLGILKYVQWNYVKINIIKISISSIFWTAVWFKMKYYNLCCLCCTITPMIICISITRVYASNMNLQYVTNEI